MTTGNVFSILSIASLGEFIARPATRVVRALRGGSLVVLATALLGTLTRSSWLGFLAGGALLLGRLRRRWLVGAIALVAVLVIAGPVELRARIGSAFDPTSESTAGRISLWHSGVAVVRDHPWSGVGLADHYALIERYRRDDATFHAGHFHNNLVQIAASTGLIGLAAYVAWMVTVAFLLARALRRGGDGVRPLVGLAVWLGFQVAGLFDWSFGDVEVVNQFYLWIGLGLAATAGPPSGARIPPLSDVPASN
jgi:O-antigen ligase